MTASTVYSCKEPTAEKPDKFTLPAYKVSCCQRPDERSERTKNNGSIPMSISLWNRWVLSWFNSIWVLEHRLGTGPDGVLWPLTSFPLVCDEQKSDTIPARLGPLTGPHGDTVSHPSTNAVEAWETAGLTKDSGTDQRGAIAADYPSFEMRINNSAAVLFSCSLLSTSGCCKWTDVSHSTPSQAAALTTLLN